MTASVTPISEPRHSIEAAIASIPDNVFWLLAKGRICPDEPLFAIQFLRPGTEYVIAEAEGDSIQECVAEALARLNGGK